MLGQRIDHRHADPMQAAGMRVVLVVEFSAGMQARQNQFHPADFLLGMNVDGHTAAVVLDLQGAVLEHRDVDGIAMALEGFVDAVVDHLVRQVVGARGVGIHARPATHRVEPTQNLDIGGRIRRCHRFPRLEGGGV
jgi:hypothetical protein